MASVYHVNPRIRAYGKARIDITRRARDEADWRRMWKAPLNTFPFSPQRNVKLSLGYSVEDFPAEIGFFIDVLGFPVFAFSPHYAQFTNPEQNLFISVSAVNENEACMPPGDVRLQFWVADLDQMVKDLEQRGIAFEQPPVQLIEPSGYQIASFRTPGGLVIELWSEADAQTAGPEGDEGAGEAANLSEADNSSATLQVDDESLAESESLYPEKSLQEKDLPPDEGKSPLWSSFTTAADRLKRIRPRTPLTRSASGPFRSAQAELSYSPLDEPDSEAEEYP